MGLGVLLSSMMCCKYNTVQYSTVQYVLYSTGEDLSMLGGISFGTFFEVYWLYWIVLTIFELR